MNRLQKYIISVKSFTPFARDYEAIEQSRKDSASVRRRDRALLSIRGLELPYTGYPLPQAGDSLADRLERTLLNKLLSWWLLFVVFILMIVADYLSVSSVAMPMFITVAVVFILALRQTYIWRPKIRKMRQGIHGERLVAEYLNNHFRDEIDGIVRVYHDIPYGTGNFDHVIFCRKGVFLLNTKAMAISVKGENILIYQGSNLHFKSSGISLKYNPVVQMTKEVASFSQLLKKTGFKNPPYIIGVVLFPGWEIEQDKPSSNVWVMAPRDMPSRMNKEDNRLADGQVIEYANKLSKWIRTEVNYN